MNNILQIRPSLRPIQILASISIAISLIGCATEQVRVKGEVAEKINRVAVVSMTAKSFSRQYTGMTVFNNEKEEIDISDWKIDAKYEELFRNQLKSDFGMTPVVAPYSEQEFSRVNDLNGPWDAPAYWGPNFDAIATATKNFCESHSLDAVVVIAKAKTMDFLAGTNQYFGGAGIYSRGPIMKVANMHLISKVALMDCATAKPLAVRPLSSKQYGLQSDILRSSPLFALNFEDSMIPIQQWSPEQKQRIQTDLSNIPSSAISETLRNMLPTR